MDKNFIETVLSLRGKEKGQKWLNGLPEIIKKYESKWGLKSLGSFPVLTFNYVEKVKTKNGEYLVLKIGFPGDIEFTKEATALRLYGGNGAVRVINEDVEDCVLLLEGCDPGKSLHTLNDETKETLIFTNVAQRIWRRPSEDSMFENISSEIKDFEWYFKNPKKVDNYLPKDLIMKAYETFKHLVETQHESILLHGDLHHDNILSSDRGWLAIDPKGVIGEKAYECASFIFNPYKQFNEQQELINAEFLGNRIDRIAGNLRLDKKRITQWAFVKRVLSVVWRIQDLGQEDETAVRLAKELEKLL